MASTTLDLQRRQMKNNVSVKEYAMRLCERATQVYPILLENELNSIFINTLKTSYYDYLTSNSLAYFIEIISTVERVEQGLKLRRIRNLKERFDTMLVDK
jgi:hypothetical protein